MPGGPACTPLLPLMGNAYISANARVEQTTVMTQSGDRSGAHLGEGGSPRVAVLGVDLR
jgi:hypothetical protein